MLSHYPWGWTTPNANAFNAADTGTFSGGSLEFRDTGTAASGAHDWVAAVGSDRDPAGGEVGAGHRGPVTNPVACTAESQFFCDDGPYGKGTGGQLRYRIKVPGHGAKTLWIAVAGSTGAPRARARSSTGH